MNLPKLQRASTEDSFATDEELIESRVGQHDSNHFQVKLDYFLKSPKHAKYQVDYYFFIPSSLGVNKYTYSQSQFYGDLQTYIRFKTPPATLRDLYGGESPLGTIRSLIEKLRRQSKPAAANQLSYELRMYACRLRATLRDRVLGIEEYIDSQPDEPTHVSIRDLAQICSTLSQELQACLDDWRGLRSAFVDGRLPQLCSETFFHVDEYVSLTTELKMTSCVRIIDSLSTRKGSDLALARNELKAILLEERRYRIGAGYLTNMSFDEDDHFVYRRGLLKKFVMSILWLDLNRAKEGRKLANVGAAIAAGLAMFFAIMATIFSTNRWGLNSINFVVAGVITYILKDRIKDWGKSFFGARFSRFLADYSVLIRDPITNLHIGRCREGFSFRGRSDVPREVLDLRRNDAKSLIEDKAKPEVIMHYSKEVRLDPNNLIERMHLDDYNVNDILRFSLVPFMDRADDPESPLPFFDEGDDRVQRRNYHKVYHINLIMVMRSNSRQRPVRKRVRVIFDKQSIIDMQDVSPA